MVGIQADESKLCGTAARTAAALEEQVEMETGREDLLAQFPIKVSEAGSMGPRCQRLVFPGPTSSLDVS